MKRLLVLSAVLSLAVPVFAQVNLQDTVRNEDRSTRSANSGFAEDDFRRGVQSYYRGAFNQSILEFEKALSNLPGEPRILEWLGKAYYRAGIEGAALEEWNYALDSGYGGILLQNRVEVVSDRRLTDDDSISGQRYTESGSYPFRNGDTLIYSQPVSSLPNPDGTVWVTAYGSNEIIKFDVNGVVIRRNRGPINGFDRPMDIIRLSGGGILVSESAGDRLALLDENGMFIKYFGSKGRGIGQVVGPQYLAEDSFGNIYVTDFGNSRVTVFDSEGQGLLFFGKRQGDFPGFKSPTGIAVVDDRIFVADSVLGGIYEFDQAGNYSGILVNPKTFARPEAMKVWGGKIILTDSGKVYSVDPSDGSVSENAVTGKGKSLVTSAVPDRNGNLIVTDFKANEIYVMSKMTELVGGFFVQFERVIADNFPKVTVEVRVENRKRQPVVGLKQQNFLITEGKRPVADFELVGEANNNDTADFTILVDRDVSMKQYEDQVNGAVREIAASMAGRGKVSVLSAGEVPVTEFSGDPSALSDFSVRALKCPYTSNAALDLSARLATNGLINAEKKRGIIFITAGNVGQSAFTKYALSDLTAFMNNNAVSFSTVLLNQRAMADEVSYMTESTTGKSYYIYRPQGLSGIVDDIIGIPSGLYQFRFTSSLPTEYGRKYLPVEVETYLLNRSGRDETGYFAPLQ